MEFLSKIIDTPRLIGLEARREGPMVAAVQSLSTKEDSFVTSLYELGEGEPRRLTTSVEGESLLAIGPRGDIYFTSKRPDAAGEEGEQALWVLPERGEARVLGRRRGAISSLAAAGDTLFVVADALPGAEDEEDEAKIRAERAERKVSGILHEDFPTRYWDHDLGPGEPALFSSPADRLELTRWRCPEGRLESMTVSEDGEIVLLTVSRRAGTDRFTSIYRVFPDREPEEFLLSDAPEGTMSFRAGPISPLGRSVVVTAARGNRDGEPLSCWLEVVSLDDPQKRIRPDFDDWPEDYAWADDETLYFTAARRGRCSIYRCEVATGAVQLVTDDDFAYTNLLVTGGELYAVRSSIISAPVPVIVSDEVRELASPAPVLTIPGTLTEVEATAEDGTSLRAWLCLPEEVPEEGAPLIVFAHGGPWGSWNAWTWRWNPGPFTDRGYAVLLPDPAISVGYGQSMIDRGNDAIGDTPFTDIMALTDATEKRADIDASRTGFAGGSYGGYMANWVAGHTGDRFRAIVTHASLWDIGMMGRTTDNGSWFEWMSPTQEALYSPHRFAANIEVPMLVIHGDRDYRVPISQGHALWHALQRDSRASGHKFLYFPDEGHWILQPHNARVWYETFLSFLDQHVCGGSFERPRLLG